MSLSKEMIDVQLRDQNGCALPLAPLSFFATHVNASHVHVLKFVQNVASQERMLTAPAGGAKVLDGLGAGLKLTEADLESSRNVLHDYGNVSSSTTWYSLGFIETMKGVKQGDKVMQVRKYPCVCSFD